MLDITVSKCYRVITSEVPTLAILLALTLISGSKPVTLQHYDHEINAVQI